MKRFFRTLAVGLLPAFFLAVVHWVGTNWNTAGFTFVALIPIPPAVILYAWSDARNRGWPVRAAAFILPLVPWVIWCLSLILSDDPSVKGDGVPEIAAFFLTCSAVFAVCSALALYALALRDSRQKSQAVYTKSAPPNLSHSMSDNPYRSPQSVAVVDGERKPTIASAIGFLLTPVATIFLLPALPKPPMVGIFFTAMFITTGSWWLATRRGWASTIMGTLALLLSLMMFWVMLQKGYWQA